MPGEIIIKDGLEETTDHNDFKEAAAQDELEETKNREELIVMKEPVNVEEATAQGGV